MEKNNEKNGNKMTEDLRDQVAKAKQKLDDERQRSAAAAEMGTRLAQRNTEKEAYIEKLKKLQEDKEKKDKK